MGSSRYCGRLGHRGQRVENSLLFTQRGHSAGTMRAQRTVRPPKRRALVTCGGYLLPECGPLFGLCPPLRLEAADCVSWAVLASCQPLLGCRLVSVNPRWDAANRCVG